MLNKTTLKIMDTIMIISMARMELRTTSTAWMKHTVMIVRPPVMMTLAAKQTILARLRSLAVILTMKDAMVCSFIYSSPVRYHTTNTKSEKCILAAAALECEKACEDHARVDDGIDLQS